MKKIIIVAIDNGNVIGINNELPWNLPLDLKRFQKHTKGFPCIMGRKTYESIIAKIGKPLSGRENVVISSTLIQPEVFDNVFIFKSLNEGITFAENLNKETLFFIGGERIFDEALKIADEIMLTKVINSYRGDAFFPEINHSEWEAGENELHMKEDGHSDDFIFVDLKRIK